MWALFVRAFLVYPKECRVYLLMLARFYLLKFPVQLGVKQLAESGQPAAVKWYFWRKSWMGLARELQTAAGINPGCLSAASAACPLSSGQLGENSRTATPHSPEWPRGTVGIPNEYMPSFPEKGLSVLWQTLFFHPFFLIDWKGMRNGSWIVLSSPPSKSF